VKCFFCDGGLCNWEAEDEPWTEHARWFPDCGFLKQVKGAKFIQKVRDIGINGGPVHGDEVPTNTPAPSTSGGGTQTPAATTRDASGLSRSLTVDQKREVRAAMSSPSVGKALETGIPKEAVEVAIKERLLAGDGHFRDDESLIEASLLANDRLMSQTLTPPMTAATATTEAITTAASTTAATTALMDHEPNECCSSETRKQKKRKSKENPPPPPPPDQMEDEGAEVGTLLEEPMNVDANSNGGDTKSLEEENLKLKEQRLCKICMDEEVSIVLLPCGHFVSCVKCAPALRNCPICRNGIKGTVRTFMA